ncbi:hypothetical protein QBK99_01450 [Corticibacterium sp. UT-5YL-CI-8]|nr:hypothetical protein [Tianweitania sp. UT-5YL-CI-8]
MAEIFMLQLHKAPIMNTVTGGKSAWTQWYRSFGQGDLRKSWQPFMDACVNAGTKSGKPCD